METPERTSREKESVNPDDPGTASYPEGKDELRKERKKSKIIEYLVGQFINQSNKQSEIKILETENREKQ